MIFTSKQDLNNLLTQRQKPCSKPTRYCNKYNKGLPSAKTLHQHRNNCHSNPLNKVFTPKTPRKSSAKRSKSDCHWMHT